MTTAILDVSPTAITDARTRLDAWVRDLMAWHFDPATGAPFWLEWAQKAGWDPRKEVRSYTDLDKFDAFQDEWLREGAVRRWLPKGYEGRPVSVFETGGSTGRPKARISIDDFRIDYEMFSDTIPDAAFPRGADWLSIGPSGPRRLRLAVEHLAQHRGGICFMLDLDPRWVIKLLKWQEFDMFEKYKKHVIDQAVVLLKAHPTIKCLFTTPKLLEALCERVSLKAHGITGIFCGGTEMTPQFHRFAVEELCEGAYFAPTYGNTLMGLATHRETGPAEDWAIVYYPPAPRAMIEVVDPDNPKQLVDYGDTGRVRLTTLTKEFFVPRFLERDSAEREPPCAKYPWDGVRNVRPFAKLGTVVVEGVYTEMPVPHLPILRKGQPYKSLDIAKAVHYRTREPIAEVSQANLGLIRRDLLDQAGPRAALGRLSYGELVAMSKRAAQLFLEATLPLDPFAGITQTPDEYVRQLSATTGMPHVLVRRNMLKVHGVLAQVDEVLGGLTRGLDLSLLDTGIGMVAGRAISFFPRGDAMGVVLPNNSPGVHSLWAPTTVLKIPLVLKPGSAEPWTPFRMIQAWLAAGCPPEAFSFYPSDHAGGNEILRRTGRGMVFGDVKATERWRKEGGRVEIHGPGFSKVILGADALDNWEQHIDTIAASVADNGGRSCVNASGVWVTGKGREIAEALAKKLAGITPRAADDEAAGLAPFVDPSVAERVSALIDKDLEIQPGVEDVSAGVRGTGRVAKWEGSTYLLPTVLLADRGHPLANREYMFPFVSVVEVPEDELPDCLGHSLVVTAITDNPELIERLVASPLVDRLNIGALPTTRIGWDQPHEGNLFEHLYARRAIQRVA